MAGVGAVLGVADEVGDHVIGTDRVGIEGRPVFPQAAHEAAQRLPVGADRTGGFAFDNATAEIGIDQRGEVRWGRISRVQHGSMNALLRDEVKRAGGYAETKDEQVLGVRTSGCGSGWRRGPECQSGAAPGA